MFPDLLKNGVWHTTNVERFNSILLSGSILPEPPIDGSERWGTYGKPETYPCVRRLGGISLFDFVGFDEREYQERFNHSDWNQFVPCWHKWGESIWIQIDTRKTQGNFIDGATLLKRWKEEAKYNLIIPGVESAHIGPIPTSAFLDIFKYSNGKWKKLERSIASSTSYY